MELKGKQLVELSMVIPLYNEAANLAELYSKLVKVLEGMGKTFELIFVDDGSNDNTLQKLDDIYTCDIRVNVIRLTRNFGQSAALAAGFDYAKGDVIISMDGDLQHDPADIPLLLEKINEGYEVVSGWRRERVDNLLLRRLPSMFANKIIARLSGIKLHDFGTTFKAYKRKAIENLRIYGGQHRFIPALLSWTGVSVAEVPIKNSLRRRGKSNYSLTRVFKVAYGLMIMNFLIKYLSNPLLIFGTIGLFFFGLGLVVILGLSIGWLWFRLDMVANRGVLLLAALCIIMGIQFITTGLLSEVISRIYYESLNKKPYVIGETKSRRKEESYTV
jgi:glycosyltransferase involved in cell wall biosynthesis